MIYAIVFFILSVILIAICKRIKVNTPYSDNDGALDNIPEGYTRVNINDFIYSHMEGGFIPNDLFTQLQSLSLSGENYAILKDDVISSIENKIFLKRRNDRAMFKCVELNNRGIEQEKSGNIDDAIATYKQNVESNSITIHPYERLMILYRKRKEYDNEISVIEKAIKVFHEVNRKKAEYAIKQYPSRAKEIKVALDNCTEVHGVCPSTGMSDVCFSPYDINKYKKRLEKAKQLKLKSESKKT